MQITAITKYKHGKLYSLLQKAGWTQAELARRAKLNLSTLGNIINLQRRPSVKYANAIQAAFAEVGIFIDVLEEWPEVFRGLGKGYKRIDTADVPMENLLECEEANCLPAPEIKNTSDMAIALSGALDTLRPREKEAIESYFYDGKTLEEIGREIGVTRERIRQAIEKGLRKLRHPKRVKKLKTVYYDIP